jgi:hypothetical protein
VFGPTPAQGLAEQRLAEKELAEAPA